MPSTFVWWLLKDVGSRWSEAADAPHFRTANAGSLATRAHHLPRQPGRAQRAVSLCQDGQFSALKLAVGSASTMEPIVRLIQPRVLPCQLRMGHLNLDDPWTLTI